MANLQSPPQSKTHTWIIVLLFWAVALLVFIAGYVLYGNKEEPTPTLSGLALANACVGAGFVDKATVATGTDCPAPVNGIVEGNPLVPGFSYPEGWHVYGAVSYLPQGNGTFATMQSTSIDRDPIFYCGDCDGPAIDVSIKTGDKESIVKKGTAATHTEAYLRQFDDEEIYTDIVTSRSTLPNGILTKVTGNLNGLWVGSFEEWVFEGTENMSVVMAMDHDAASAIDNDGWTIVKNSLDFSEIK